MIKTVADLVERPSVWLDGTAEDDIVVSSRVRLARNIKGELFPSRAPVDARVRLMNRISPLICGLPSMSSAVALDMAALNWTEKHVLCERHLISVEQSENGDGSGVVLRSDESVSIMINEEDHLRMQALSPGLALKDEWQRIDEVDTELERHVGYAFSRRLGYLTACPSNLGSGLRASVMLHLPALGLLNEMEQVFRGLTRIGLAVRGLLGEGTDASGNMFQISNQMTLGEPEKKIVDRLADVVLEVSRHEKNARARLVERRKVHLMDHVGRAYGLLMNAQLLSSREMLDLLSSLRLGVNLGIVHDVSASTIRELMLLTQPGHMQIMMGRELSPEERDQLRARMVRDKLRKMSVQA
ncbi:MAG: protein arginine kinase [bacterium]